MTDGVFNTSNKELPFFGNYTPDFTDETDNSSEVIVLACIYTIIFGVGVFGNGSLLTALLSQHSSRIRNPLLVGLSLADLLVCACSGPLSAAIPSYIPFDNEHILCDTPICILLTCVQCFPVSASTLSLMMLSVDRYVTVQHPRFLMGLQKKPILVAVLVWILAAILTVALPVIKSQLQPPLCTTDCLIWSIQTTCIVCYVIIVLILPTIIMMMCHLSVRSKLCALSLTARAAHGELPLPMPLLRRPTHVIIVAGMANNTQTQAVTYDCTVDERRQKNNEMRRSRKQPTGGPQRGASQKRASQKRVQKPAELNENQTKPSLLAPQPQTSTLQSRRRLANVLVSVAAVFAGCWLPHAISCIYAELSKTAPKYLLQYSLLLGHAHSAINPVVYWALNHQTLRQQGNWPCQRAHRYLFHFKFNDDQPPSSTNEAALGPFHPRYTRARPVVERAAPSSHYLY